ncbi:DNA-binding transcriptional repressor AcrR [Sebaldella termitidis]|uniref:Transcriptional regulator, TetR family n=1 Tax=Sebaldella termitidis (strain ATCC 33386 / NCTC 11300) TaxID=526218 RepID=D1AS31_SEBTE|nr:TetR/AcrR family transcriptional regulator [Sebaldella termitidis]ACZ11018.1 transcriptional regulator, TetR family [Sebaldella termitidis ATCC 33386]SUI81406.1 DNA-binding transcriptional repressor AcrR [Sebaldella termitidis]
MDKKDVIKITLELIKEKKLEKASIGEIVKRLELSPGNLYYHFKNKSDIYKEAADYSAEEIIKNLNKVRKKENKRDYLYNLTKSLIKFLEEREEILCFLLSMKGTCFLDKELESQDILIKFKKLLLEEKDSLEEENKILLKLSMFMGSIYEVLYINKLVKKKNLNEEEIQEISESFWGNNMDRTQILGQRL